jgi:catechol 2,3-dioxygenase-like lactoylglutathione lyase family enzyme
VTNVFCFVEDLDQARWWYERLLGTNPVEVQPQLVTFEIGSVRLTLHVGDEFNTPAELHGTVAYWGVDDVDDAVAQAVALGAVAHRGPKTIFTAVPQGSAGEPFVAVSDPIAQQHGGTPQQIALAWQLHRTPGCLPIPGTTNVEH